MLGAERIRGIVAGLEMKYARTRWRSDNLRGDHDRSVHEPPRSPVLEPGSREPAPGIERDPMQPIDARTGTMPFADRDEPYDEILRCEISAWQAEAIRRGLGELPEATWRTAAATLSLLRPVTPEEARDVLSRLPEASAVPDTEGYARLLFEMLSRPAGGCALHPESIAEHLIIATFVNGEGCEDPEKLLDQVLPVPPGRTTPGAPRWEPGKPMLVMPGTSGCATRSHGARPGVMRPRCASRAPFCVTGHTCGWPPLTSRSVREARSSRHWRRR
jgi:hypothetical protein